MDPEVVAHLQAQIDRLKADGHIVEPIDVPLLDFQVPTYYILATAEASSNLARFDGIRFGHRSKIAKGVDETYRLSRTEGFGPEVKRRILLGTFVLSAGYYDAYYAQAQRVRRIIRDKTIQHAIKEAYRGLIEPGRHPTAVLLIEMDPRSVDVNVHPAKTEVRFRESSLVHSLVLRTIREALQRTDLTAGYAPSAQAQRP